MSSIKTRAMSGAITGLIQNGVGIITQLILVPIVLKLAGQETMGAYAVLLQLIGYVLLLDFGFAVAYQRFLAQTYNPESGSNQFAVVFRVGKLFLYFVNLLMCLVLIAATLFLNLLLQTDQSILTEARLAILLQAIWIVLRTPLYVYGPALLAVQKMTVVNLVAIPINCFRLLLSVAFIYADLGLAGLVLASIVSEATGYSAQRRIFLTKHRKLLFVESNKVDWQQFLIIFKFGKSYWGVNLSNTLLFGSDNIIASALFGAASASVYYTTKMIGSLCITILSRAVDNVYSGLTYISAQDDLLRLKAIYLQLLRYVASATAAVSSAVILFTDWSVNAWVGSQQYAGDQMAIAISILVFLQTVSHLNGIFALAIGKIDNWNTISLLSGLLSTSLSVFLGILLGMKYMLFGICIGIVPTSLFLLFRITSSLKITLNEIYYSTKNSLFFAIILIFFAVIKTHILYSLMHFLTLLLLYFFCCAGYIWFFVLKGNERVNLAQSLKIKI